METNNPAHVGYLCACIAGDHRYSSRIDVFVHDGKRAHVVLSGNGAVSGSTPFSESQRVTVPANARDIVKAIKNIIRAEQPDILRKYGKPSKNFVWVGVKVRGLLVERCQEALFVGAFARACGDL